jgi:enoyl-CoA hydratase
MSAVEAVAPGRGDLKIVSDPETGVATITIDRAAKLNSLTSEFWGDLRSALARLEADGTTRAIVITGAGERAFSAGGDIHGFSSLTTPAQRRAYIQDCMATFAAVESCELPVIAAINGIAFGGGCELALACDIVFASDAATFAMPEAAVGLVPGFGVQRAPSVIGRQWSKYLIMSGGRIDAGTAERIGLVQRVVPAADLTAEVIRFATKVASQAPMAVGVAKQMINEGLDASRLAGSVQAVSLLYSTEDSAEGIAAFAERRKPAFKGA